ncbi:MAG: helix-turn-helix domain-containing protein [Clostridium sp.]
MKKLKLYRIKKGYSQKHLGSIIGTSQNHISDLENGRVSNKIDQLILLAYELDVCITDLIDCPCKVCQRKRKKP